ncbi:hypothetical protein [Candidatus Entotheonella palauensis]|uniref:hypothetical protein n=1 Tax=Candidatus Entotheonella palauensis TaxID=93172 RepID=UPI000B7C89C5|nr:hypothetical protein [Candidatus Entotheonella palauensis]
MSYLDLPRINFSGRFFTNVSTINNDLRNYPPGAPINEGWNPDGTALFSFDSATVTGVQSPRDDGALLGAPVTTATNRAPGKLVDIDPDFQQLSQVIGVSVSVMTDSGAGFTGSLEPCNFQDFWSPQPTPRGRAGASQGSVTYISVLSSVQWTNAGDVEVLRQLRDSTEDSQLAIRFIIGSYFFDTPDNPESGFGQLLGTIAPHRSGDPTQFVRRRLMPPAAAGIMISPSHEEIGRTPPATLQACNFNLEQKSNRLSIDLGNAVPIADFGGPPSHIGQLRAVVLHEDGTSEPIEPTFSLTPDNYKTLGGIIDLELTAAQSQSLYGKQAGVELQPPADSSWTLVLAEHRSGKYVNISPFTARAVGGPPKPDTAPHPVTFELYAFQWGEPLPGESLSLSANASQGTPASLIVNGGSGTTTTGSDGRAAFTVEMPTELTIPPLRQQLDSLAYNISGPWIEYNGGQLSRVLPVAALLVWAPYAHAGITNPTWEEHVQPVFDEYMRIYPGMKKILDLSNLNTVQKNLESIRSALSLPFDAPHTMPVTRDLSPEKIEVINTWLTNQITAKSSG